MKWKNGFMKVKINGYFCVVVTPQGKIEKSSFLMRSLHMLKKEMRTSHHTLLFYFPRLVWASQPLSLEDLELLFFYLGQFLCAHLSLKSSFENFPLAALSRGGQKIVQQLSKHVQDGHSLEQFFKANAVVHDPIILSTLIVAERMGRWDRIFQDLNVLIRNKRDNQSKVRSLLVYPVLVLLTLSLFVIFILPPIVSNMTQFFQGVDQARPLILRFVEMVERARLSLLWALLCCGLGGLLFKKRISAVMHFFLRRALGIDFEMEHFFYLLSFLLHQEISLLQSLSILSKENSFPSIASARLHKSLHDGQNFSQAFADQKRFPEFSISLLRLSQETSNLVKNVERIHFILFKIHERNIQKTIAVLPSALILFVGGIFIGLITTIFLPIYEQAMLLSGEL